MIDVNFLAQMEEKTISIESIYEGSILRLEKQTVLLPNGRQATRDIVRHNGASAVVAITESGRFLLVRQYRKPCDAMSIEIPAGKRDTGEEPYACAMRELEEETGYTATDMRLLFKMHSTPGFSDELLHVYVATRLEKGHAKPDADEFISHFELSADEVLQAIRNGEITDGKTIAGILAVLGSL